jgi:hypothetical protein
MWMPLGAGEVDAQMEKDWLRHLCLLPCLLCHLVPKETTPPVSTTNAFGVVRGQERGMWHAAVRAIAPLVTTQVVVAAKDTSPSIKISGMWRPMLAGTFPFAGGVS